MKDTASRLTVRTLPLAYATPGSVINFGLMVLAAGVRTFDEELAAIIAVELCAFSRNRRDGTAELKVCRQGEETCQSEQHCK